MNRLKYVYIILLSVLFLNNDIISMKDQDYMATEQELQLLSLLAELIEGIINETVIQQVKQTINKDYDDIFNEPKTIKVNLQNIALVSQQFKDVLNVALKSQSFKDHLNQLVKDLKSKRFDELFEQLKEQSIEEYKGLSTQDLNKNLFNILNKEEISKDDFKEAVRLILAGADVNAKDENGKTALRIASSNGCKEIVQMLIKAGANVNAKDENGQTALIWSSLKGHKEIVQILIEAGTNINATDIFGRTALMYASQYGHKDIVQMLIEAGAK